MRMSDGIQRVIRILRRRHRARRLGIPYTRPRDFCPPDRIWMGDYWQTLRLPADHGTKVTFHEIFIDDVYRLRQAARPIRNILDIGAHCGLFSLFSRTICPAATIHAYEPNPTMLDALAHHSAAAGFRVFAEAVGNRHGRVCIEANSDSASSIARPDDSAGTVPLTPLTDVITRLGGHVDFLKLDAEGAEWDVLRDPAMAAIRNLSMEYHLVNGHTVDELVGILRRLGFVVTHCEEPVAVAAGASYGLLTARRG